MNNLKTIKFIDSDYRELFTILDGESILITYPPTDGRGVISRKCNYAGECHVRVGNEIYHICEFAEKMEQLGAKYEPENKIRNTEIVPYGENEKDFFNLRSKKGKDCLGIVTVTWGNYGDRFSANVASRGSDGWEEQNGVTLPTELYNVIYALRQKGLVDSEKEMISWCKTYKESYLEGGKEWADYGFKMSTDHHDYFIRCRGLSDFGCRATIYVYKISPERTKEKPARQRKVEFER